MADTEVDYESDNALMEEETPQRNSSTKKRVVKGRGGREKDDRYAGKSGEFDRLDTQGLETLDSSNAVKSVEGWIVVVTGVHEEAQEDDIVDQFAEYGPVKNIHVNLDRRTGFVKGYALIEYEKFKEAKDAIEAMNGESILGEKVHVDWAFQKDNERDRRRSGGGGGGRRR